MHVMQEYLHEHPDAVEVDARGDEQTTISYIARLATAGRKLKAAELR